MPRHLMTAVALFAYAASGHAEFPTCLDFAQASRIAYAIPFGTPGPVPRDHDTPTPWERAKGHDSLAEYLLAGHSLDRIIEQLQAAP